MRVAALLVVAALCAGGTGVLIELESRELALSLGGALLVVGLLLLVVSRWQLGSAFAFTPRAKSLVTSGLYSRIPHPMYVFLDLALLGGIMLLGRVWLLGVWAGLIGVQAFQAGREARILAEAFGDAYRDYRKRTWW